MGLCIFIKLKFNIACEDIILFFENKKKLYFDASVIIICKN